MGNRVRVNREENRLEATRTLRSSGDSIVISIPPQLLEAAGLSEGDQVEIAAKMNGDEISFRLAETDEE